MKWFFASEVAFISKLFSLFEVTCYPIISEFTFYLWCVFLSEVTFDGWSRIQYLKLLLSLSLPFLELGFISGFFFSPKLLFISEGTFIFLELVFVSEVAFYLWSKVVSKIIFEFNAQGQWLCYELFCHIVFLCVISMCVVLLCVFVLCAVSFYVVLFRFVLLNVV